MMEVSDLGVDDASEAKITSSTQINGGEDEKPAAAVTILTNKPLVYNYEDTAADEWPQDGEPVQGSSENKPDENTSVWPEASTEHSDRDDTTLPGDIDSESIEHAVIDANEEIDHVLSTVTAASLSVAEEVVPSTTPAVESEEDVVPSATEAVVSKEKEVVPSATAAVKSEEEEIVPSATAVVSEELVISTTAAIVSEEDEDFPSATEEVAPEETNLESPKEAEPQDTLSANNCDSELLKSENVCQPETPVTNLPDEQFETVVILRNQQEKKEGNENEESNTQNLHRLLIDDWDVDDGSESHDDDKKKQRDSVDSEKSCSNETPNGVAQPRSTPKQRLFLANRYLSRQEAVKEILKNKPTPLRSLIPKKDLILAMELAKHSTTGVGVELDEPDDILQILESDQVGDWREALPPASIKHGNDTEIMREVNSMQSPHPNARPKGKRVAQPSQAKAAVERRRQERLLERKLALEQLAKEFKTKRRKRSEGRTLAVAAEDLERALSATPVLAGKRKRRPCYLPEEKTEEVVETKPSAIIKTYVPKPKSSDSLGDVETALETIAIVNRHLNVDVQSDPVQETEGSKLNEADKAVDKVKKKRPRELQQLLGDEGAVRMIYDAAQKEEGKSTPMFKKTKKGLLQKTKFVENAVLRASGASEKSLRGKRLNVSGEEKSPEDTLFPPATPGSVQTPGGRQRKKPKPAEASRILYRHSSSESFDGSEGLRRSVSEIDGLDMTPERPSAKGSSTPQRKSTRPRKVSSKLSAYVAEPLTLKRKEKKGDVENRSAPVDSKVDQPEIKPPPKLAPASAVKVIQRGALVEIVLVHSQSSIRNGLRAQTILSLTKCLEDAKKNSSCRAILFKTEGKVFCQGIDLGFLAPGADISPLVEAIKDLVQVLVNMEKPIMAGVQGTAVGFGAAMLPLFDVVVASDASTFWTPYARLGQGLEAGASFTFPHISRALVSELIYKGSVLTADEALHLGLITEVVPGKEFTEQLSRTAADIAAQSDQGLRMVKELMSNTAKSNVLDAVERECALLLTSWTNPECLASIAECLASGEFIS